MTRLKSFDLAAEIYLLAEKCADLDRWNDDLPLYLQHKSPSPPAHKRAIAILNLKYWITKSYITRRFLLHEVQYPGTVMGEKAHLFEGLSIVCIAFAEEVVSILEDMATSSIISELDFFDTNCLMTVAIIFLLAHRYRTHASDDRKLLHSREVSGRTQTC